MNDKYRFRILIHKEGIYTEPTEYAIVEAFNGDDVEDIVDALNDHHSTEGYSFQYEELES